MQLALTGFLVVVIVGVVSDTYAAVSMTEFIVEGHRRRIIERLRMQREIDEVESLDYPLVRAVPFLAHVLIGARGRG